MKFALSNVAVATGLVLLASSALADPTGTNRPLSNYSGADTTNVYLAGSSAVDLALTKFFAKACDANTLDVYRSDAGVKTYYLWTCETTSPTGFALASGHTKIAIHKNTNSSSDGVNLLADTAGTALFLKRWLRRPFAMGAVVPSGPLLARAMAETTLACMDGHMGHVIELEIGRAHV